MITMYDESERRLFQKVTGVIKKKRGHSKGGFCGQCMQHNLVGTEDRHGMWHYRCPFCVTHQNPKDPNPCPRCKCTAHETICDIIPVDSHFDEKLKNARMINPFKPDITIFRCLNCSFAWTTPEYEKFLLVKAIRSISSTSEFSKNPNV